MATTNANSYQLTEAVLSVFAEKPIDEITLSDIAAESGISSLALRLKYGSVEKIIENVAIDCFETVFSVLHKSVFAGKKTEECWLDLRDVVVDNPEKVLFYEAFRSTYNRGFEQLEECEECARHLFPAASDLSFLWYHFIFDAKKSALKVISKMKEHGISKEEASVSVAVPNLNLTSMRPSIVGFDKLCAAI